MDDAPNDVETPEERRQRRRRALDMVGGAVIVLLVLVGRVTVRYLPRDGVLRRRVGPAAAVIVGLAMTITASTAGWGLWRGSGNDPYCCATRFTVRLGLLGFVIALSSMGCGTDAADLSKPVAPLAKVDGHRTEVEALALVEIAYDRATAEQAWRDNVPEGLPRRGGEPEEPGVYADLADVDFASHAVVVWSYGQSGFDCWGWLSDIQTEGTAVKLTTDAVRDECTDDYNAYSMVLAVSRDRLPKKSALPIDDAIVDGRVEARGVVGPTAVVDVYPATGSDASP